MTTKTLLDFALEYHDRGLAVVPIGKGKKSPVVKNWQTEKLDRAGLEYLFNNGHNVNGLGVVTGQLSGNLVCLDFDGEGWQPAFEHFLHCWGELENAPIVETGSGKRHIYITIPDLPNDFTRKTFARGNAAIELRGNRMQALLPPSLHPSGGRYHWVTQEADLPQVKFDDIRAWLSDWSETPQDSRPAPQGERNNDHKPLPRRTLEFLAISNAMPPGNRNSELYAAAQQFKVAGYTLDETINTLTPVAQRIGLDDSEIGPTIQSGYNAAADFDPIKGSDKSRNTNKPTHDELADNWIKTNENICFGLGDWRCYEAGLWPILPELSVKHSVLEILKAAKEAGINPTDSMVGSVANLAKYSVAKPDDIFDADPDFLVCRNGALHIPTRTLQEHRPELYATSGVSYDYDPGATCEAWTAFLFDLSMNLSQEVVDFLQEFAGYSLTTDTQYEIALWLYGPPGSGKSTFLTGLESMLGSRAGLLGLADIERSRFALANLPGKTLAIATEQPSSFLASTDVLNAIISGELITIDRKFRDAIQLTPRAKIAWAMNELPRVSDPNSGLFRRVKVVEFPVIPEDERDTQLKERIKTEGAGILNWALEGLDRLRQRGRFDIPASVVAATDNFRNTNDIPAQFVAECCVTGTDETGDPYKVKSSQLYKNYRDWCFDTGHKPQSSTSIAQDWRRLKFEQHRGGAGVFWWYVGLFVDITPLND